ncbi:MAG TPA: Mu transposase C-terminal domain-containing protein [Acetobacteraceae bacterium]|nr:Mu transposase C-terminal domain-containing protein [Acetobacteraceae bacterium]
MVDTRLSAPALVDLSGTQRRQAMIRFAVLQPHLEGNGPLARTARDAGVPIRTAERWLMLYRRDGLAGLTRRVRGDAGTHRLPPDLVTRIEGMGLKKPRSSAASIHRRVAKLAKAEGWPLPSYGTVHAILAQLDPAMVSLALDGPATFRDRYELIHRHRAETPNAIWQADHTMLDIMILDEAGKPVRPWLTVILDDHSRAVTGTMVFIGAPSVLNTCLALRHAIWRKTDPAWPVCGVPDMLYVDHGCDFTSNHLDQVAAALRFQVVYSAVGRPQGRGKVERLFGTINTELLPDLPGRLVGSTPATAPRLSLAELDHAVGAFIAGTYNMRIHSETNKAPLEAWREQGFLPRLPDSLEELDLLLVMHAKPRVVQRDGIHFEGLRYISPTLASHVREPVTIRYDPRDLSEIRVFHRNQFLCRAVSEEHAAKTVTLKDIEAARRAHRRALRTAINERVARVADFLPAHADPSQQAPTTEQPTRPARVKLRLYEEDGS